MTTLRRRMMEDMQVRSLSPQTQATYVQQVSLFARHFNRSPELLGPEEIRSYQVHLTNERKLAPSSISIAISALRFLYRITLHKDWSLTEVIPTPKKPKKLPIVPSPEEVLQFLGCVWNIKHRTILTICYAAGLRVSEACPDWTNSTAIGRSHKRIGPLGRRRRVHDCQCALRTVAHQRVVQTVSSAIEKKNGSIETSTGVVLSTFSNVLVLKSALR